MIKLTKTQVKALVKKELCVHVQLFPSNCGPANTIWVKGHELRLCATPDLKTIYALDSNGAKTSFDSEINSFSYYNCNSELGQRVHYYVEEKYTK